MIVNIIAMQQSSYVNNRRLVAQKSRQLLLDERRKSRTDAQAINAARILLPQCECIIILYYRPSVRVLLYVQWPICAVKTRETN